MVGTPFGATPEHERVASELRQRILSGEFPPGSRIPSRKEIACEYGVGNTTALEAMKVLLAEGLVEGRRGSGTYVREHTPEVRIVRYWRESLGGRTPMGMAMSSHLNDDVTWTVDSAPQPLPAAVAERLGVAAGDPGRRNEYLFTAAGRPVMLFVSWEPDEIVAGTPILLPERGPLAGQGLAARMRAIGIEVVRTVEDITARPALTPEAERLEVPTGTSLILFRRTWWTADRPVETAEALIPGGSNWLRYELPADVGSPTSEAETP